ncbi:MAG: response regulator transcription factor [Sulfuricurvum sp.]|jgi:two-component system KDP operon response regulator KdpE|nr:response regulator transcription factor [Sulfuricurvum sp.]
MNHMPLVLVIEDDDAISRLLSASLRQNGYKTLLAADRHTALRELQTRSPDLILLDLGLPDGDGKELITAIRQHLLVPIIVVSARSDEKEIIASLDAGADDYVVKPFSTSELLARVRSTQRRFLGLHKSGNTLACSDLVIDLEQFTVAKAGVALKLTRTEFSLLKYFMLHPNEVLSHTKILKEVWGVGYQHEMQYLRTYVNALRKKIEKDTTAPAYIQTELGIGYRFICSSAEDHPSRTSSS